MSIIWNVKSDYGQIYQPTNMLLVMVRTKSRSPSFLLNLPLEECQSGNRTSVLQPCNGNEICSIFVMTEENSFLACTWLMWVAKGHLSGKMSEEIVEVVRYYPDKWRNCWKCHFSKHKILCVSPSPSHASLLRERIIYPFYATKVLLFCLARELIHCQWAVLSLNAKERRNRTSFKGF